VPPADRRASPIAGHGLFATADIPAGTLLVDLDRDLLNHSCDPNLGWAGDDLAALCDIAAGSELTLDYATFVDDPGFVMMCHCETYRCRQVVEGTDWQIPQLRQRYAGHWHPALQKRIEAGR
jgi:hypothetical protein